MRIPTFHRDYLYLTVVVVLATVPFLNKAFHVDDQSYLEIARHILADPLRPYNFESSAMGRPVHLFARHPSPPFLNYVLAAGIWLFGEREVPLHCLMAVFAGVAAIAQYALAQRFSAKPLFATVLVILNPLFLPGQNLMLDMPALALGLAGVACHIAGTDRSRSSLSWTGGLLVGLAIVTKYPALVLVPLLAFYSFQHARRIPVLTLIAAFVPLTVWSINNLVFEQEVHFFRSLAGSPGDVAEIFRRITPTLVILGSGLLPVLLIPLVMETRWRYGGCVAASLIVAILFGFQRPDRVAADATRHFIEFVLFLASGLAAVLLGSTGSLAGTWRNGDARSRDSWFLIVWFVVSLYVPLRAPFLAVRHVVWLLPPAVLLLTRLISRHPARAWCAVSATAMASLGLGLAWADMELANLQRRHILQIGLPGSQNLRMPTYYLAEYGFAYYCDAVGIERLPFDWSELPRPFAVVEAVGSHPGWKPVLPTGQRPPRTAQEHGRVPLNTVSHGVNYYVTGNHDLPWDIGKTPEVYFQLHIVRRREAVNTE